MTEEKPMTEHEVTRHKALVLLSAITDHDPELWNLIVDYASSAKLDLPGEEQAQKALSLLFCIRATGGPKLWNLIVDFASSAKLDLPIAVRERTLDDYFERGVPNAFFDSPLYREIQTLLKQSNIPVPESSFAGPCITLEGPVRLSTGGQACVLSVSDDEFPGSALIEITDEKLLEKLRSVNGQFTCHGYPVFYYENYGKP